MFFLFFPFFGMIFTRYDDFHWIFRTFRERSGRAREHFPCFFHPWDRNSGTRTVESSKLRSFFLQKIFTTSPTRLRKIKSSIFTLTDGHRRDFRPNPSFKNLYYSDRYHDIRYSKEVKLPELRSLFVFFFNFWYN